MPPENTTDSPREGDRIAKLLARAGVASRREVERLIEEGRVSLNGEVLTTPATVLTTLAGVTVDGKPIGAAQATRIFMFHKPSGLITAERDPTGRPTIYTALRNALPEGTPRMMPVGRLDLNTEGLLLLTNDGELKRALELPSTGIPRTYRARTFGDISQDRLEALSEGIEIEGIRYGSINANMERRTGRNQWIEMSLTEGKNREVRRVLEHLGLQVSRLLRLAYGPFHLGELPRGAAEEVPHKIVERFLKDFKLDKPVVPKAPRTTAVRTARPEGDRPEAAGRPEASRRDAGFRDTGRRAPTSRDTGRADSSRTGAPRPARAETPGSNAAPHKAGPRKPATRIREEREELDTRRPGGRRGRGGRPDERPSTPRAGGPRSDARKPDGDRPRGDRPDHGRPGGTRPEGRKPAGARPTGPRKPTGPGKPTGPRKPRKPA
ncbi:pseudouridine synthase [Novosphingobium sp. KCTC 2891]|uniref:pseudouridine synthase n=1 Tax=Novosphingobium sp. KCTC 2891 TaxID=2989730 RepID=UPI002222974C|nr:pseudouridine synthase [Novosphingobium sp. KCTC 2891]MCW1384468.1 pseudouridine synthase [Novosphingobium sp. KCTC 2891]